MKYRIPNELLLDMTKLPHNYRGLIEQSLDIHEDTLVVKVLMVGSNSTKVKIKDHYVLQVSNSALEEIDGDNL